MKIKINSLLIFIKLIFIFIISKCSNLINWNLQKILLLTEAANIPLSNRQLSSTNLTENDQNKIKINQPIVERIEIRLIDNIVNGSNEEKQLMIVDVVKKQGSVAATIQQQNEFMEKINKKPWFLVRIRQPYYHSTIYELFDKQNNLTNKNEILNNLINGTLENEENETIGINKLIKNESFDENLSEENNNNDNNNLEEEKKENNKTIKFDEKEECLINKANLDEKTLKKLLNERKRIVRTIKKVNQNQFQLCRINKRTNYEFVLYRKCPMWRREKFFLYYALMRITYCGNHDRWPGGIYYKSKKCLTYKNTIKTTMINNFVLLLEINVSKFF